MSIWSLHQSGPDKGFGIEVNRCLEWSTGDLMVVESPEFGKLLIKNGRILLSDSGEDPYHEMLALVPLSILGKAKNILITGGSDGSSLDLLLKSGLASRITITGIEREVFETVNRHFPRQAAAFRHQSIEMNEANPAVFARDCRDRFDLIVVDTQEVSSPQFPQSFFCDLFRIMTSDGAIVIDCGGWSTRQEKRDTQATASRLKRLFPVFRIYESPGIIPITSSHVLAMATKTFDPSNATISGQVFEKSENLFYVNAEVAHNSFFLHESLKKMSENL